MKKETMFSNCFEEYILIRKTENTIKINFDSVSESVKDYIMNVIINAIETEAGYSYEYGDTTSAY